MALRPALQHRPFASGDAGSSGDRGSSSGASDAKAASGASSLATGAPTAVAGSGSSQPLDGASGAGAQVPVLRGPTDAAELGPKGVETIESILIRSHRKEVIERAGPDAVRYMPSEDPTAFLIPDSRLDPGERVWQKVFVALPWLVFAAMLSVPLLLVQTNLPFLQRRAEDERRAAEARAATLVKGRIPDFTVVNFSQMPDILERPYPTVLLLFDPSTFASALFLPFVRDLEALFRSVNLRIAIAALDLSATPGPSEDFLWQYPRGLAPHLQLIIPRAREGEAGVVDYHGSWNAIELAEAARELAGEYPPDVPMDKLLALEEELEQLREAYFELLFVDVGPRAGLVARPRSSWWAWLRGRTSSAEEAQAAAEERRASALAAVEPLVDTSGTVERALISVRETTARFANAQQQPL